MTKSSINCPYCNGDIIVDFSKVKTSKGKKKKEVKVTKIITMNDFASVLKAKDYGDLTLASLSYFYFIKDVDKVSYRDLYRSMKNADKFFSKMKGNTKDSIIKLQKDKKIIEPSNQIYSLNNKELKRIEKAIKKYI
jgi:sarcosine oxidase delta subunit